MFKSNFIRLLFCIAFLFAYGQVNAQCSAQEKGKNIVQNPGFELGDTLFTNDNELISWNECKKTNSCRGWSEPGEYYVASNGTQFNAPFKATPHSGNMMLMVDGKCKTSGSVVVWEQTVYVYPNTNYYFSLWIASLNGSQTSLNFEVNGQALGITVKNPNTSGKWQFYEDVWNSGLLEGEVKLRILNLPSANCNAPDSDDFAIDDISFIPGCEYGAPGPVADLGEDISICGSGGKLTLNSGVAAQNNVSFLWNTGEITPTIEITAPGIYYVCVDSVSACPRSDVIEVLSDYSIGLQSDVDLCNPATVTLDPGYNKQGVTYRWFKDDKVIGGQRKQQLLVNTPGKYVVEVNEPICGIRTDTINVTSSAAIADNAEFCPPAPVPTLNITGPGNYLWYDSPALDNEVANGATYTPTGISTTTTYYVKDTTSSRMHFGQQNLLSHTYPFGARSDMGYVVSVAADLVWDSVSVYVASWNTGTANVGISIYDITSGSKTLYKTVTHSVSVPNNGGNPSAVDKRIIPVKVDLIGGKKYLITTEGSNAQFSFHDEGSGVTFPYSIPGFITMEGLQGSSGIIKDKYGVFYDWVVTVTSPCKPIPVIATAYCPPICTMPEFVQLTDIKNLCGENKMLKAIVTPSENYEYEFFRNGSSIQQGAKDSMEITQEGTYKVLVTDPKKSDVCFLESASIAIENTLIGDAGILTGNSPVCEDSEVVYTIPAVANADSYTWQIPAGSTIIGDPDGNSITVKFGSTAGEIKVTPSNIVCGVGKSGSLLVSVDPLPDPAFGLSGDVLGCIGDTLTYSISPVNNANGYTWSVPVGSSIVADNGTSIDVKIGSAVYGSVFVTPYNDCGNGPSGEIEVMFSEKPAKASIKGDIRTCIGAISNYYIDSVFNASGYLWELIGIDASVIGNADSIGFKVQLGSAPAKIVVTAINSQCGNGVPDTLTVNEFGPYYLNVEATPKVTTIDLGQSAYIGAEVVGDSPIKYMWLDQNVNAVSAEESISVSPILVNGGTVSYYIQVTDVHGCIAIDTAYVNIVHVPLFIPNLITPNNDGKNDYFAITGITPGTKISIHNRWGQIVYSSDHYDNSWKADNVSDGIYYVHIELGLTNEVYKSWLQVLNKED
jgi:gliding motility-associated-like protein